MASDLPAISDANAASGPSKEPDVASGSRVSWAGAVEGGEASEGEDEVFEGRPIVAEGREGEAGAGEGGDAGGAGREYAG
ncbi:unnamed protein product [Closterium sp. NIES-54]